MQAASGKLLLPVLQIAWGGDDGMQYQGCWTYLSAAGDEEGPFTKGELLDLYKR